MKARPLHRSSEGVAALCLLLAGCTGSDRPDDGAAAGPEVRDSAGVRLVTYAPPAPWTLPGRLAEELRIGELEGGVQPGFHTAPARMDVEPPDVDSLAAAYVRSELEAVPEGEDELRRRRRESLEAIEWPARSAYFVDLVVTEERVLLEEIPYDGDGRWFAFAAQGIPSGYLPLPPGATLLDMTGDRILVAERTALDVPQVVLYSLDASGGDGG